MQVQAGLQIILITRDLKSNMQYGLLNGKQALRAVLVTSGRTPTAEKSTALTEMLIPTLYLMLTIRAVQQQRLQRRNTPELKLCRLG